MRPSTKYILIMGWLLSFWAPTVAQQVRIEVPISNVINKTEFSTTLNVLQTGAGDQWINRKNPSFEVRGNTNFTHTSRPSASLPASILLWQLESIGGTPAPFRSQERLPSFKWFSTSPKNWYEPHATKGHFNPGNVAFRFKIPAKAFEENTFIPGEYALEVTHNYDASYFSPVSFQVILVIPSAQSIDWVTKTPITYHEISSLDRYRMGGTQIFDAVGAAEIANTTNFNLLAKTNTATIQRTSPSGVVAYRPVSLVSLGSAHPNIQTTTLSDTWKNLNPATPFKVERGNKHQFNLELTISENDFKTHFFEAGTYKLQLNLDAKSTDHTVSAVHNTDFSIEVLPLSEITIPPAGNNINFEFNTPAHYQNGQTKLIPSQLKISNNKPYELCVKSDNSYLRLSGDSSDVPASILQVGIAGGSQKVTLTNSCQNIITDGAPVLDKDLDMIYTISARGAQSLVGKEKGTYSINIMYSFTAL
ncbi:hypothetical protein [Arenibacter lacus]|uniref:hypothetical protein n=1 Tax=Arenibacter lacus TaxID=2608629 RepID=UPI00123D0427|nr:hypothetical protein [Arenibacter lacus]